MDPFWKIAHKLYRKERFRRLARFFECLSMIISSHAISAQIEIGQGSKFYHHGLGCVCLETTKIGRDTVIFQNVTFGANWHNVKNVSGGGATVGDRVMIGAGAVILGNLKIGNDVSIGANAVVTHDIPNNCVAFGIPARYKQKGLEEDM